MIQNIRIELSAILNDPLEATFLLSNIFHCHNVNCKVELVRELGIMKKNIGLDGNLVIAFFCLFSLKSIRFLCSYECGRIIAFNCFGNLIWDLMA